MACKLKCPKCQKVLKEEGDGMKEARGEYRVYDSLWNSKHPDGYDRMIRCLLCNYTGTVPEFDEDLGLKCQE